MSAKPPGMLGGIAVIVMAVVLALTFHGLISKRVEPPLPPILPVKLYRIEGENNRMFVVELRLADSTRCVVATIRDKPGGIACDWVRGGE